MVLTSDNLIKFLVKVVLGKGFVTPSPNLWLIEDHLNLENFCKSKA